MNRRIILFVAAIGMVSCGTSQTKDNDPWGEIDPGQVEAQSVAMDRSVHSQAMNRDMTYSANTAAIQAAKLDICRGLQKFYGQELPIFLDSAECFDEFNRQSLAVMDTQLILLCVSEDEGLVLK